jgi:L-alanine-DL-glutamate epimerase-like enolase superfamily enzyme
MTDPRDEAEAFAQAMEKLENAKAVRGKLLPDSVEESRKIFADIRKKFGKTSQFLPFRTRQYADR